MAKQSKQPFAFSDEKLNELAFNSILNRWKLKAVNRFTWKNLPPNIESRKIEQLLFDFGSCIFVKDKERGYMVLQNNAFEYYDVNYRPTLSTAIGFSYIKPYNVYWGDECEKTLVNTDGDKIFDEYNTGILIQNNPLAISAYEQIIYKVWQLYNIERALDVNVQQLGLNNVIVASIDDESNVQILLNNIKKHKAFNAISEDNLMNQVKTLDLKPIYFGSDLHELKKDVEYDLEVILGYNNQGIEKKHEVLLRDEINANNEMIESELQTSMKQRKFACDLINDFFGTNISIECDVKGPEEETEQEETTYERAD